MHPLDSATWLEPLPDGSFRGHTHPAYANMVGPFGGVIAACLLQAPLRHAARIGEPIALTVNFAAALSDGEFNITARPARTNRSTQHWSVELTQGGEVAASATAVFAVRRPTWSAPEAAPPANLPPPEALSRSPSIGRPAWTRHYDMRFARGGMPEAFDGEPQLDSVSQVWVRDEPPRPLDFVSLAALCDSFFPRIFVRRRKVAPIGTVSLTTYFHADSAMLATQGEGHVLGTARGLNFRNGYFDQSAEVWSQDWQLLASSHQIVYYRE
ncbi:MAG: thioesterase family protein [Pseudomonadota bacterium]|nr:thioesterase family protein [Pseudomonadota bacterium]